jgi:hypothetical protein
MKTCILHKLHETYIHVYSLFIYIIITYKAIISLANELSVFNCRKFVRFISICIEYERFNYIPTKQWLC